MDSSGNDWTTFCDHWAPRFATIGPRIEGMCSYIRTHVPAPLHKTLVDSTTLPNFQDRCDTTLLTPPSTHSPQLGNHSKLVSENTPRST
ncbi:hypothetical protein ACSQ67_008063 [Phaseolus vulgaris]